MAQLEKILRAKKVELEGVVTKSNRELTHHKADMKQAKKQVCKNNGGEEERERRGMAMCRLNRLVSLD